MAQPSLVIRIAANIEELKRNLKEGRDMIETTTSAMTKMAASFSGDRIIQQAHNVVAVVDRMGGAARLTETEQAKVNRTVGEAIAKYEALGQQAPQAMRRLYEETKQAEKDTVALGVAAGVVAAQLLQRAASAVADFGKDALLTAARVESLAGVARFMGSQAGYSATEVDTLAAALQKQGITSAQSYDTIIQMVRANMSLADATKLATVAQGLARATGENSSATLGKLIQGTQTLQVEVLRNAGVVIQLDQEYKKFALTQGRSVESLGAQEKQQIALAAVLREGEQVLGVYGVTNEFVGGKIQSMKRHTEEASLAVGTVFKPALSLGVDAATALLQAVKEAPVEFSALAAAAVGTAGAVTGMKGAVALGAMSAGTMTTALGFLWPAVAVGATAFGSWKLGTRIGEVTGATDAVERLAGRVMGLSKADIEAGMAARKWAESAEGRAAAAQRDADALKDLEAKARAAAAAAAALAAEEAAAALAAKEAAKKAKEHAEALEELKTAGDGWRGTLATMNEATIVAVQQYLDAGVSQGTLAKAYDLTATQIRAVARALKEEQEIQKITDRSLDQTARLWEQVYALRIKHGGTATQAQLAQIDAWFNAEVTRLRQSDQNYQAHYAALRALADEHREDALVDWRFLAENSRQALQDIADRAMATYRAMMDNSGDFARGAIDHQWRVAQAARDAAWNWREAWDTAGDHVKKKTAEVAQDVVAQAERMGQAWRTHTEQMLATQTPVRELTDQDVDREYAGRAGAERRVREIEGYYRTYPGAAEGGSGPTGLAPGDADGYRRILAMRREYAALKLYLSRYSRALGGPVSPDMPYLVGERGPEWFVPRTAGQVLPTGTGVGSTSITLAPGAVVINYPLMDSPRAKQELARLFGEAVMAHTLRRPWA